MPTVLRGKMVLQDGYKLVPSEVGDGEGGRKRVLRLAAPSMMETARLKGFEVRNSLWTWGEDDSAVRVVRGVTAAAKGKEVGVKKKTQKRKRGGKKNAPLSFAYEKPCKDAFGLPSPLAPSLDKYWHQRSRLFSSPEACVTPLDCGELGEPQISVVFNVPEESVAER